MATELNVALQIDARANIDALQKTIDELKAAGGSTEDLERQLQALTAELNRLGQEAQANGLESVSEDAQKLRDQLNATSAEAEKLRKITEAKITLGLANDDEVKKQIEEVGEAYRLLQEEGGLTQEELAKAAEHHREKVEELENSLKRAKPTLNDVALGIGKVVGATAGLAAVSKSAIEFETAMAGVKKVVDGTPAQMEELAGTVKDLAYELGKTPEAVAEIAAMGGQLGVAFGQLPEFTRLAGQMSVAFGMTAEQAAEAAAKISNVFGITLEEMRGLGDAINVLGNNTAAKEAEITAAMLRIGGTAKQFGLAAEQAAALADAFIALGKPPEVAATAINALLTKLQTAPAQGKEFQKALDGLGISANELARNIRENPERAIVDFLGKLEQMDKQSRSIALTKLFGAEYADDISLAAGSLDTLRKAFGLVADKAQTAGAMQREFEAAMNTTGAKIEQAKIALENIVKTIGSQLLPIISTVADGIGGAANAINKFAGEFPLVTQLATYLVSARVAALGVSGAMGALGISTRGAMTSAIASAARFGEAFASLNGFVAALKTGLASLARVAWLPAGIGAAVALYQALKSEVDAVNKAQQEAMKTWADAAIAQNRLNMAVAAGADVQGDYVQEQQRLLRDELAAINQRIAGYQEQKKAAESRFFVDEKAAMAADKAIAAEEKRRASIEQTVNATQEAIDKAKAEAEATEKAARAKELSAQGWDKLTSRMDAANRKMQEIPENSQRVIDGLDNIIKSGQQSAASLELAFRQAIDRVETVEALREVQDKLTDLSRSGLDVKINFEALADAMKARSKELPKPLDDAAYALKALGLEVEQVQGGIGKAAAQTLKDFGEAAARFGTDADKMRTIFQAALKNMHSPAEVQALIESLRKVGERAGRTKAEIEDIARSAGDAASKTAQAFAKIGVDISAVSKGISSNARQSFDGFVEAVKAAKEEGTNSAKAIRAAFDHITAGLKTKEEFAEFNRVLAQTGAVNQLATEQMQQLRAGMQGGAEAANAMREAMKQGTDATRESAEASKAAAEAKEQEAAAERKAAEAKKEAATAEKDSAAAVEEATEKKKKAMMTIYDASKLNAEAVGLVDDAINRMVTSMGHMDADDYLRKVEAMSQVGQQYVADVQRAEAATERLNQKTSDGTVSMHDIAEATHAATSNITALDSTTLRNLNASIDAAKKKLEDLQQQAKDTAADLDAELAQLKGDDSKTAKLEQQRKLRELEGKLQEARIRGNAEEIRQYERALELQRQIGAEKARQAADKKAEAAARAQESRSRGNATPRSTTTSSATSHGAGDISPQQVVDALDDRTRGILKNEGAQEFARQLLNEAKRSPR